jgi:hypothetical protein
MRPEGLLELFFVILSVAKDLARKRALPAPGAGVPVEILRRSGSE